MQEDFKHDELVLVANVATKLETALRKPNKSSVVWQADSGKLVSLAYITALDSATSDFEYLRSLALCQWAKKVGVAEAKKKVIQATRFRSTPPPTLGQLGSTELITAALELLVSLRASWCKDYISNELLSPSVDKKGAGLLLNWAQKTAVTATDFIEIVLAKSIDSNSYEKRAISLVKDVAQKITFGHSVSADIAASDFAAAVQFTCEKIKSCESKKIGVALVSLLLALVQKVRLAHPAVVIQGSFVLALQAMQVQLLETTHKKAISEIAAQQVSPTLSALADLCHLGGVDAVSYSKLLLPSLKKAYSNFDKSFDEACRRNAFLQPIKEAVSGQEEVHLEDSAISLYARILPTWLDFYRSQNDPAHLSLFNADLLSAAKLNGIEFLGTAGDVLPFDPVAHRVEVGQASTASQVRIVRPAVIFRRTNNSYRIVLPAIVSMT